MNDLDVEKSDVDTTSGVMVVRLLDISSGADHMAHIPN